MEALSRCLAKARKVKNYIKEKKENKIFQRVYKSVGYCSIALAGTQFGKALYETKLPLVAAKNSQNIQQLYQYQSEYSKSALEIRSGELGKSGPGPRAKADARRNVKAGKYSSGSTIIPGADALVPQNTYCLYHQKAPLSCKPRVKLADGPFQGDGDNNQPPPENGNFDASQYKGGPNPFLDKFDYDNPNHTRENTDFSSQKRMNHAYDRHAEKCFGMKGNRNKENLKEFEGKARNFIESPETEKINGSYRYETPTYFYKEKDSNLVAIVNATDNSFITVVNATKSQLESIQEDQNFGLDTRSSMQLTLRLRGPKNHN